jgi:hypothetical protein
MAAIRHTAFDWRMSDTRVASLTTVRVDQPPWGRFYHRRRQPFAQSAKVEQPPISG